jgi:SAM-dependent methyltransferase
MTPADLATVVEPMDDQHLAPPAGEREDAVQLQLGVLEALGEARNYNDWIVSLTAPHLGDWPIEIGSGLGDHAHAWLEAGVPRITVTDIDESCVSRLDSRFGDDLQDRVEVLKLDLDSAPPRDHSSLVAVNVLEHIEDDVGALRAAERLLRDDGRVVVFAPAHGFAFSRFDTAIGHVRRYTLRTMRRTMTLAGLDVEELRYVNAPGLVAWIVGMKWLRLTPSSGLALRAWDRGMVPLSRRLESRVRMPFGQSVFAVGKVR